MSVAISLIPSLLCNAASTNRYVISGGQNDRVITMNELLSEYELYSTETEQVRNKYILNQLNSELLDEQKDTVSESVNQLSSSLRTLTGYKNDIETKLMELDIEYNKQLQEKEPDETLLKQLELEISTLQSQLLEISNQISTLNVSLSSASSELDTSTLESDLQRFYVSNRALIQTGEIKQLTYDFLSNIMYIILLKEQYDYSEYYETILVTKLKVEHLKEAHGLSNNVVLSAIQLDVSKNETIQKKLWSSYKTLDNYVREETLEDKSTLILEYSEDKINYSLSTLQENFLEKNKSYLQLNNTIEAYTDYLSSSCLNSSTAILQVEKTIESYRLQKILLFKEIESYVKSQKESYDQLFLNLSNAKREQEYANQQYDIVNAKYKYGRATLLELQEKELIKQEARLNYYKCIIQKIQLEYIFQHSIYGVTVE